MKAKILISLSMLSLVAALSIGAKLYASCYDKAFGDCEINPPLTCIPNERDWEMHGNDVWDTCYCEQGQSWKHCEEKAGDAWCMAWFNCDSQCTTCTFDEDSSFPVNQCQTSN